MKALDPSKVQVFINHRGEIGLALPLLIFDKNSGGDVLVLDPGTAERIGCALLKAVKSKYLVPEEV